MSQAERDRQDAERRRCPECGTINGHRWNTKGDGGDCPNAGWQILDGRRVQKPTLVEAYPNLYR